MCILGDYPPALGFNGTGKRRGLGPSPQEILSRHVEAGGLIVYDVIQ